MSIWMEVGAPPCTTEPGLRYPMRQTIYAVVGRDDTAGIGFNV